VTEAGIIAKLRDMAEEQVMSKDVMRWLSDAARRTQRLVFRAIKHSFAAEIPVYAIGPADAPAMFTPSLQQLEPAAYLHLVAKSRGWVSVDLGSAGHPRRLDMARHRLNNTIAVIGDVAPALADELRRIEGRCQGGKVFFKLPERADSPHIEVA